MMSWLHQLRLATLDTVCQVCGNDRAAWLCEACETEWINPQVVTDWPSLNTRIYSLCLLADKAKSQLYAAKFYDNGDARWWCTALLAMGYYHLAKAHLPPNRLWTLATLPSHEPKPHWMQEMQIFLSLDTGIQGLSLAWKWPTLKQHLLTNPEDRWRNLENSLVCPSLSPWPAAILVLDDITTTGASLYAACAAIRQAGFTGLLMGLTLCYVPKNASDAV